MNLLPVVIALVVVGGVIVVDHFKGPFFPHVLLPQRRRDAAYEDVHWAGISMNEPRP